jgi:S1-C subfamily serine protease
LRVEGKSVDSTSDLRQSLRARAGAGGDVSLSILRHGSALTINVKFPKPSAPDTDEVIQRVEL